MWNEKEIRKRILRETRNKSKLFNQCHATPAVSIPGNETNETNVTVSGLYKPLISNRSGFLPRPRDWSTHPGPDELTASDRGL